MTKNGISTCTEIGQENYEAFVNKRGREQRRYYQYDYRHDNGQLFSCVKPTLQECRDARDRWLLKQKPKQA